MKKARLCLGILSLLGIAGCDLGDVIMRSDQQCPIDGQDSYIVLADGSIIQRDNPEYADIFRYNVCPKHAPYCLQAGDIYYCASSGGGGVTCNGIQVDLNIDRDNCGECGIVCSRDKICSGGQCVGCTDTNDCSVSAGWSDGTCDSGVCRASACQTGYYLKDIACFPNDNANCGKLGEACAPGTNCVDGECVGCTTANDCAVSAGWSNGECTNGICKATGCVTGYYLGSNGICNANTNENCGDLGNACAAGTNCIDGICVGCASEDDCRARVTGWSEGSCEEGICKASVCATGYYVAGDNTCQANTNTNCGELGNACAAGTNCIDGECVGCTNDADCAARVTGWSAGTCDNGICRASDCRTGYYVAGDNTCQANDNANCGALGEACAAGTNCISGECIGCTGDNECAARIPGWSDGECTNGVCEASACTTGYYLAGDRTCRANDNHNCGELGKACAAGTNCNAGQCKGCDTVADCAARVTGWSKGTCDAGMCKALACTTGYYVDGANTCKANDNANCGELNKACAAGTNCNAGQCKGCEKDADCAARVTGWSTGKCDAGVCKAESCTTGYYVDGANTCQANDNANCGALGEACAAGTNCSAGECKGCEKDADCAARVTRWSTGKCDAGICKAETCSKGYYVDGSLTCQANDNANCGALGEACAAGTNCSAGECKGCEKDADCAARVTGWSTGKCDAGICKAETCSTGYYVDGSLTCKANDNANCGALGEACAAGTNCIAGVCKGCEKDADCAARVTGWSTGKCDAGICKAETCSTGYYVDGSLTCKANDNANCGALGEACAAGTNCSAGVCKGCEKDADCAARVTGWSTGKCDAGICKAETCSTGYYVDGDSTCHADTNWNCGQLGNACYAGTNCIAGMCVGCTHEADCAARVTGWSKGSCIDGVCKASACTTGYYVDGSLTCKANDNANCGALGEACAAGTNCSAGVCKGCEKDADCAARVTGWSTGKCDAGICKAETCSTGYYVDGSLTCKANDNANCGALGEACAAGTNCSAGVCKGCEKDADCAARVTGWSTGKCDAGICKASACTTGYYVDGSLTCKANDNANCGALGEACAAGTNCSAGECVGCTNDADCAARVTGWSTGKCEAGICKAETCSTGYYVDGSLTCKANDNANCGALGEACAAGTNCSAGVCKGCEKDADCAARVTGWSSGRCDAGVCKAETCSTGYYVDGSLTCKANDNANCGALGEACAAGTNCSAGICKGCEKDADCAARVTGWSSGKCDAGVCKASSCVTGYYVDGSLTCKANDNANCGELGKGCAAGTNCSAGQCKGCEKDADCAARVTGWSTGRCDAGICNASSCVTGYYVDGDKTCKANNNENCGVLGNACASGTNCIAGACVGCTDVEDCKARVTGWSAGTCDAGVCKASACTTGYYKDGSDTCKANDNNNCGELGKGCAAGTNCIAGACVGCTNRSDCAARVTGWADGTCDAGVCKATVCTIGYYIDGSKTCKANDNNNCGSLATRCAAGTNCIAGECAGCTSPADCAARVTGWSAGTCDAGVCKASACTTGYYKDGSDTCRANDNNNCGELGKGCVAGTNCIAGQCVGCTSVDDCRARVTGWAAGTCDAGVCKASACTRGYYKDGSNTCKANDNNNCGELGKSCKAGTNCIAGACVGCTDVKDCTARVTGWSAGTCDAGVCKASACTTGYYVDGAKTCKANDNNNCGMLGKACASGTNCIAGACVGCTDVEDCKARVTGWAAGTCDAGVCKASACTRGYYKDGSNTCKANDNNNCGELGKSCKAGTNCIAGACVGCTNAADCAARVTGWSAGTCDAGVCKADACVIGYYLSRDNTCQANTNDNCGVLGKVCEAGTYCNNGTCITACSNGQENCNGYCADTSSSMQHCGGCEQPCNTSVISSSTNVYCQNQCIASECAAGYRLESGRCVANTSVTHCGPKDLDCTITAGWAGGVCLSGLCRATRCISGYYLAQDYSCKVNDINNCGVRGRACTSISNADSNSVACVNNGCKVFACRGNYVPNASKTACITCDHEEGYKKVGNACEQICDGSYGGDYYCAAKEACCSGQQGCEEAGQGQCEYL